jgi:uncharacterized protein (UPF0335 family)
MTKAEIYRRLAVLLERIERYEVEIAELRNKLVE